MNILSKTKDITDIRLGHNAESAATSYFFHHKFEQEQYIPVTDAYADGYMGNFQISWQMIWQLIKAKFKKGTLYIWALPESDNSVYIEFYREIDKKFNIPKGWERVNPDDYRVKSYEQIM